MIVLFVVFQVQAARKCLQVKATLERFFTSVISHMHLQGRVLHEGHRTQVAAARLLACTDANVLRQVTSLNEAPVAFVALVRLLIHVNMKVICQIVPPSKGLATVAALKGAFASVSLLVFFEISVKRCVYVTLVAHEPMLSCLQLLSGVSAGIKNRGGGGIQSTEVVVILIFFYLCH